MNSRTDDVLDSDDDSAERNLKMMDVENSSTTSETEPTIYDKVEKVISNLTNSTNPTVVLANIQAAHAMIDPKQDDLYKFVSIFWIVNILQFNSNHCVALQSAPAGHLKKPQWSLLFQS